MDQLLTLLQDNLDYNTIQQYTTTLTQAQLLNSTSMQSNNKQPQQEQQLQDSSFMSYQSFPLLRMTPPQLHQPTIAKEPSTFTSLEDSNINERAGTPIRITRPPNAYLLFNKEMRKTLKESNPSMKVGDISKEIGLRWKTMPKV